MGVRALTAGAGLSIAAAFYASFAYHSRDIHYSPQGEADIIQERDGPHLHVFDYRGEELADINLTRNEDGELVGQGVLGAFNYEVFVGPREATFIHRHGMEKLGLGRDVVHVKLSPQSHQEASINLEI